MQWRNTSTTTVRRGGGGAAAAAARDGLSLLGDGSDVGVGATRRDQNRRKLLVVVCIVVSLLAFSCSLNYLKQKSKEQCLMSPVGIENTKHMLRTIASAFDKHNVSYWIDYGTLLGSIREGRVLEWAWEDLDVSFFHEDLETVHTLVRDELERGGRYSLRPSFKIKPNWSSAFVLFTNVYNDETTGDSTSSTMQKKNLSVEEQTRMYIDEEHSKVPACDLYAWKVIEEEGKVMKLGYVKEKNEEHQVRDLHRFFRPLPLPKTCLVFDLNVSCPHHSVEYLRTLYGDDALLHSVPKKYWKCALHLHFFEPLSSLLSPLLSLLPSISFISVIFIIIVIPSSLLLLLLLLQSHCRGSS
eukprot:TRINITY_DN1590_c0_g1_i1.p1 TRINITY_DN1590_c0_g1~~TRINITY_DN1590_c0_g1_i1.p1  ORF type:complete len:393 (-),score=106.70 TRINITY_DN1590_c0_g1_i1:318-1382(-)